MSSADNYNIVKQVFNNPDLLDAIIDHSVKETGKITLSTRLISNAFNQACLRKVRRSITELFVMSDLRPMVLNIPIYKLFKCETKSLLLFQALDFINFLADVAKIRVNKLEFGFLPSFPEQLNEQVHSSFHQILKRSADIIRVIFGLKFICPIGCEDCIEAAKNSKVYGPMQVAVVRCRTKMHFQKVQFTPEDLDELAILVSGSAATQEQFNENLSYFIDSNTTANNFAMCIPDNHFLSDSFTGQQQVRAVPFEILKFILKTWKVKEVSINVYCQKQKQLIRPAAGVWSLCKWITKFYFHSAVDEIPPVDLKFEYLCFELKFATLLDKVLTSRMINGEAAEVYKNIFTTMRKLFPADNMDCFFDPRVTNCAGVQKVISGLQDVTWRGNPRDFNLNISLFVKLNRGTVADIEVPHILGRHHLNIEKRRSLEVHQHSSTWPWNAFKDKQERGCTVVMEDISANSRVNVTLFID